MDPLITNGTDPALLRVIEKRGQERHPEPRRRRVPAASPTEEKDREQEPDSDTPKHEVDDLA